jgi:hypothetical protein
MKILHTLCIIKSIAHSIENDQVQKDMDSTLITSVCIPQTFE